MTVSRVDQIYRRLLLTKFFTKGWGKPDNLKRIFAFRKTLSNRDKCQHLVSSDYPINIDKEYKDGGFRVLEGHFTSPFVHQLPGIMPPEVETASFQMLLPEQWQDPHLKPVCIHLAGTGDHYFWRRRLLTARPLLRETGIASILLENPYYGSRKPKGQLRSSLHNVSDLFVMGGALVLESMALLHWCERQGWGPLGISGISMGGHMASLAATNWTKPITLVPCLSWSTASIVFTQGVMSGAIPWETLQEQFFKNSIYQDEIKHLIVSPERLRKSAYNMGQQFVKDYSGKVEDDTERAQKLSGDAQHYLYEPSISAFEHHTIKMRRMSSPLSSSQPSSERSKDKVSATPLPSKTAGDASHLASSNKGDLGSNITTDSAILSQDSPLTKLSSEVKKTVISESLVKDTSTLSNSQKTVQLDSKSSASDVKHRGKKYRHTTVDSSIPITLSYARTKGLQQQQAMKHSASKTTLPEHHAISKSGLMPPFIATDGDKSGDRKLHGLREEAFDFMRGVMDECTHLGNFSIPVDPELVIIVSAQQDGYIPRDNVIGLDTLWPGSEVRHIDQGHVGAVILHQKIFRQAIVDAFDRQIKKYYPSHPGLQKKDR